MSDMLKKKVAQAITKTAVRLGEEFFPAPFVTEIFKIPELQQTIADAERYKEIEFYGADDKASQIKEWKEKAEQFDKIFEGLGVEEKCPYNDHILCSANENGIGDCYHPKMLTDTFNGCDGTGTVSRPLTEKERVEAFEGIMKIMDSFALCSFLIKSGVKVVRGK